MSLLQNNKSSGPDNILNEFLKNGSLVLGPILTKLFNTIVSCGHFPTPWTEGFILPIHLGGDKHNLSSYRGITLVSCLSKLFTRILNTRIIEWSNRTTVISDAQFDLRPGLGTTGAIL